MTTEQYQSRLSRFLGIVIVLFTLLWISKIDGERVILLHKNQNLSSWHWLTRFEFGLWSGWSRDGNSGHYEVCDVSETVANHTNSWLVSEYVDLHDAKEVHVELEFVARQCPPSGYPYCKQNFNVYALQTNGPVIGGITKSEVESGNFVFVDSVNASSLWTAGHAPYINQANITLAVSTGAGLYVGLQDRGACIALVSVTISYAYCPKVVNYGAVFKKTPAPPTSWNSIAVNGTCFAGALASPSNSEVALTCLSSGQWLDDIKATCLCSVGFELVGDSCSACSAGYYKDSVGNEQCIECPSNSQSSPSRDSCPCQSGFYRTPQEANSDSCSAPPSAPRDINITVVMDSVAVVAWSRPDFDGSRKDLKYDLRCTACPSMGSCSSICLEALFLPSATDLEIAQVMMSQLNTDVLYNITVFSKNGVSDQAGVSALGFLHKTFSLTKVATSNPPSSTTTPVILTTTEESTSGNLKTTEASIIPGKGTSPANISSAIGISVAGTFVICFIVAAIIIFLLGRIWRKKQFKHESLQSSVTQLTKLPMYATQLRKVRSVTTTTELSDIGSDAQMQDREVSPPPLIEDAISNSKADSSVNNIFFPLPSKKPLPSINIQETNSDSRPSSADSSNNMTPLKKKGRLPVLNWSPPRAISPILPPREIRGKNSAPSSPNLSPRKSPEGSEQDRCSSVGSWFPAEEVQYNI